MQSFVRFSLCTVLLTLISLLSFSQNVSYAWGGAFSGNAIAYANAIVADADGNTYTVGSFSGTRDFDPGAGAVELTSAGSNDAFVCKLDAAGQLVWVKQIGGADSDGAAAIAFDAAGNLLITGTYRGTVDFDPNAGVAPLTDWGAPSVYVCKLSRDGNYVWAKTTAGTSVGVQGIALDAAGNILLTGRFNASSGTYFSAAGGSVRYATAGANDVYVQKLDANGNGLWVRRMGGTTEDLVYDIAVDQVGSVYTVGWMLGAGNFGGVTLQRGVFISKIDTDGNYRWAKGLPAAYCNGIAADTLGHLYITGVFANSVDLDPGAGVAQFTSAGSYDAFVMKLDTAANYQWAKAMGGTNSDWGEAITVDAGGNVYSTGYFYGTADFDPGPGVAALTTVTTGNPDVYISKLDNAGNFVWVKQLGGPLREEAWGIATDAAGNVYTAGHFDGSIDLDPGVGSVIVTSAAQGLFVSKLMPVIDGPLPLTWLQVEGTLNSRQQAVLRWRVAENSVRAYAVEKSSDGITFNTVGTIAGQGDGEHTYSFTESTALQANAWYRIKQIDLDGVFSYSTLIRLSPGANNRAATVYPVPARESFTIQVYDNSLLNSKAVLVDMNGRPVKAIIIKDYNTPVNLTAIPPGVYLLQLANGNSIKIVRQP